MQGRLNEAVGYLIYKKIISTQEDIADRMQASKATVSRAMNGKEGYLTPKFVHRFNESFENIFNEDWILNGVGEMIKYQGEETITKIEKVSHTRPHIPISAVAGKLCEYYATVKESDCERYPLIAGLPDYNFTIPVVGNSMIPEYRSGDIVACKYVEHEEFIQWGKSYIIDTTQGIVFKKVMPIDTDDNSILCVSFNKDEFPCYKLKKEFIYSMAVVVGIARRE